MGHFEPFLKAILANPDDDLPRLILADSLEEHNAPEHAEFIRLQIDLARRRIEPAREAACQARARTLQPWAESSPWNAGWKDWARSWTFHRGMIEEAEMAGIAFARFADIIRDVTPLRSLRLTDCWESFEELGEVAPNPTLRALSVQGNSLADWECRNLVASPWLAGLRSLDLSRNSITDAALESILNTELGASLHELDLSHDAIGSRGALLLATAPTLQQLRFLRLRHARITASGVEDLMRSTSLNTLERLDLSGNAIGTRGLRALVHGELTHLDRLILQDIHVPPSWRDALRQRYGSAVCVFDS